MGGRGVFLCFLGFFGFVVCESWLMFVSLWEIEVGWCREIVFVYIRMFEF